MYIKLAVTFAIVLSAGAAHADKQSSFEWLENIDGEKALSWVRQMNKATDESLGSDSLFKEIYEDALTALNSKDKLPQVTLRGEWIYRLYKDEDNPRGIYQRTRVSDFQSQAAKWQTVIDVDALSKAEGEKWVFSGLTCLEPENIRCLMSLSPGGTDANEMREFNLTTLEFVEDGFKLPTSKMQFSWINQDELYVATNFGDGSMTESGYPRITKRWQRGTPLAKARTVFEVEPDSVWQYAVHFKNDGNPIDLLVDGLSFWKSRFYQLLDDQAVPLALPETAVIEGLIKGQFVVSLKQDWDFAGDTYPQGSVVLVAPDTVRTKLKPSAKPAILVTPTSRKIVEDVNVLDDYILVTQLEDVKSVVHRYAQEDGKWQAKAVALPDKGTLTVQTTNDETGEFFVRYEGFVTPPTLFYVGQNLDTDKVLQQSATFDGTPYTVSQHFAESKDGTKVPYFLVMHKDTKLDGRNPTHIFSYGGFRVSLLPSYSGSYEDHNGIYGKAWLERGGVFVLANIRGGGEYGPAWHAAALLENKTRSYEDFEAVAESLIERKITSPKHLGIEGRSNGGLLVGATMVRRPDLYGAVICGVPLLDMKRYHTLLAGASWMAEFGNPDTDDWSFIKEYSPYQNVSAKADYPPIYFFTSTKDDRVHPGHARKMAALMKAQGHAVEYFENIEGGHKGSATSEQTARRVALGFTHLWRHLRDQPEPKP